MKKIKKTKKQLEFREDFCENLTHKMCAGTIPGFLINKKNRESLFKLVTEELDSSIEIVLEDKILSDEIENKVKKQTEKFIREYDFESKIKKSADRIFSTGFYNFIKVQIYKKVDEIVDKRIHTVLPDRMSRIKRMIQHKMQNVENFVCDAMDELLVKFE